MRSATAALVALALVGCTRVVEVPAEPTGPPAVESVAPGGPFGDARACGLAFRAIETGASGAVSRADRMMARAYWTAEPGGRVESALAALLAALVDERAPGRRAVERLLEACAAAGAAPG